MINLSLQVPNPNLSAPGGLVNPQAQDTVYIGLFLLLITAVIVIGLLSKKLEYALVFAFILSLALIGLLWFFWGHWDNS